MRSSTVRLPLETVPRAVVVAVAPQVTSSAACTGSEVFSTTTRTTCSRAALSLTSRTVGSTDLRCSVPALPVSCAGAAAALEVGVIRLITPPHPPARTIMAKKSPRGAVCRRVLSLWSVRLILLLPKSTCPVGGKSADESTVTRPASAEGLRLFAPQPWPGHHDTANLRPVPISFGRIGSRTAHSSCTGAAVRIPWAGGPSACCSIGGRCGTGP
jgi:hypothetical protein